MTYAFGNAQHIGARSQQQDSFCFSDPDDLAFAEHAGVLAVLTDGMGGMAHGDAASQTAAAAFLSAYRRKTPEEDIPGALSRSLLEANAAVYEVSQIYAADGDIGTTLVAAILHGPCLHWISVGDSAIMLRRGDQLAQLNSPHVYAAVLDAQAAAGAISAYAALSDPQREALISHVGLAQIPHVDRSLRPLPLDPGDVILLASDGLFKTLASDEMLSAMEGSLQNQCDRLVEETLARRLESQDNITVLEIAVAGPEPTIPEPQSRAHAAAAPASLAPASVAASQAPGSEPAALSASAAGLPSGPAVPPRPRRLRFAAAAGMLAALAAAGGWWWLHTCCQPAAVPIAEPPEFLGEPAPAASPPGATTPGGKQ